MSWLMPPAFFAALEFDERRQLFVSQQALGPQD